MIRRMSESKSPPPRRPGQSIKKGGHPAPPQMSQPHRPPPPKPKKGT
jgi:hypothetical protein